MYFVFFFSSRRRHTRWNCDWSSDVCSSDLPFAGFVTGWSYWFMWVVMAMAELTAIGIYVRYWFPDVPQWLPALIALVALYGTNLLAVRVFGELEFWFALIKVVTIVALIVAGIAVI